MDFKCKNIIKAIYSYYSLLVWRFKYQINIKFIETVFVSERTIWDYFAMFRSIAEKEYLSDINKYKLGIGIVQIDESHFFKAK